MIKPAIDDKLRNEYNRYALVVGTAKCARVVTDEFAEASAEAERLVESRDGGSKPMPSMVRREVHDEKPVLVAIDRIVNGTYRIVEPTFED